MLPRTLMPLIRAINLMHHDLVKHALGSRHAVIFASGLITTELKRPIFRISDLVSSGEKYLSNFDWYNVFFSAFVP